MIPADGFNKNEIPIEKVLRELLKDALDARCVLGDDGRVGGSCPFPVWTTLKATDGLRMEPAVAGILIFLFAMIAKWVGSHRGAASIEGAGCLNRVSRTALGATDHRVHESSMIWIKQFSDAGLAGREVGDCVGSNGVFRSWFHDTFSDGESVDVCVQGEEVNLKRVDAREVRGGCKDVLLECLEILVWSLSKDHDTVGCVGDRAFDMEGLRKSPKEGSQADALEVPAKSQFDVLIHRRLD